MEEDGCSIDEETSVRPLIVSENFPSPRIIVLGNAVFYTGDSEARKGFLTTSISFFRPRVGFYIDSQKVYTHFGERVYTINEDNPGIYSGDVEEGFLEEKVSSCCPKNHDVYRIKNDALPMAEVFLGEEPSLIEDISWLTPLEDFIDFYMKFLEREDSFRHAAISPDSIRGTSRRKEATLYRNKTLLDVGEQLRRVHSSRVRYVRRLLDPKIK